jgi:hypothetical protein
MPMDIFKVRSHVGEDGVLHLAVPTRYVDADIEVEVMMKPAPQGKSRSWPDNFFTDVIGSWEGEFAPRDQGEYNDNYLNRVN